MRDREFIGGITICALGGQWWIVAALLGLLVVVNKTNN